MASKLPTIYLGGAIRDNRQEDILWREQVIIELQGLAVFINPLAGQKWHPETSTWSTYDGSFATSKYLVKKDFHNVDKTDILVVNFQCLTEGYPTIGSLIEFGRATRNDTLIYSIVDPSYRGHGHKGMYDLHPFIEENSAMVFKNVPSCVSFLKGELKATSGLDPHYAGVIPKGGTV